MKLKSLLVLLILMFAVSIVYADYNTPGTGKVWTLDSLVQNSAGAVTFSGGAYFFNTNIFLANSDTLKILNNAVVKVDSAKLFTVYGTLIINPPDSVNLQL